MSTQIRPNSPTRAVKRARADHSTSASPARESPTTTKEEANLPAFLRQSKAEISGKFEKLNNDQLERLKISQAGTDQESQWAVDYSLENRLRNRYLDIRPWEKQRIRLQVPEGSSDYINASPITLRCSGTDDERRYIATQGPKHAGVDHFWQMVWQEAGSPAVIVMLTQLAEGFKEKCYQYFPEDEEGEGLSLGYVDAEGTEHTGTLRVVETIHDEECKTHVRKLELNYDSITKTVYHLFFMGWSDYGVPQDSDRAALLSLMKLSREKNEGWKNPRIIHCSAGVGRSGTFIALEHLLEEVEQGLLDDIGDAKDDPVFETVNKLREQRMTMVQNDLQFAYIYEIIADAYRERRKNLHLDDQATPVDKVTTATAKLSASGEPSPKAIRLTRGFRRFYEDIRSRSHSRHRAEEADKSVIRTGSEPPTGRTKESEKPGTPLSEVQNPLASPS